MISDKCWKKDSCFPLMKGDGAEKKIKYMYIYEIHAHALMHVCSLYIGVEAYG